MKLKICKKRLQEKKSDPKQINAIVKKNTSEKKFKFLFLFLKTGGDLSPSIVGCIYYNFVAFALNKNGEAKYIHLMTPTLATFYCEFLPV